MVQDLVKRSPLAHGARRLACKTASYGALHVCVAAAVAYAVTGDLSQALGIGTIEPLVQTGVFALHDRLWERRSPAPADDLRRAAHWLVYGGVKARS